MQPFIYVFNNSALVSDDEAQKACAAVQRQVIEHFEPIWKCSAVIHFAKQNEKPYGNDWAFRLVDEIDIDAFGYHTFEGLPAALIDVAMSQRESEPWSRVLSHEVLEAVADPECVRCFDIGGKVVSLEVSDAVEGSAPRDGGEYEIDGFTLENFVTPNWFIPGSVAPWDFLGVLPGPLTRTDGGYDTTATIGEWRQHSGEKTRPSKLVARAGARRAVRFARSVKNRIEL